MTSNRKRLLRVDGIDPVKGELGSGGDHHVGIYIAPGGMHERSARGSVIIGNLPLGGAGQGFDNLGFVKERVAAFVAIDHNLQGVAAAGEKLHDHTIGSAHLRDADLRDEKDCG